MKAATICFELFIQLFSAFKIYKKKLKLNFVSQIWLKFSGCTA